jgi:hypothetical protein
MKPKMPGQFLFRNEIGDDWEMVTVMEGGLSGLEFRLPQKMPIRMWPKTVSVSDTQVYQWSEVGK